MTPMLEKIARAAADADAKLSNGPSLYANNPAVYQSIARAALLAMREPDEVMQNIGVDVASGLFDGWVDEGQVSKLFTAMIDAILAGETET